MKIILISVYFGEVPKYVEHFIESCGNNPEFDFIVVTDSSLPYRLPGNMRNIVLSFQEWQKKISSILGDFAQCNSAYKVCDFKPAFGELFHEYIYGYDYWGYNDIDLVFGRLWDFLSKPLSMGYQRVLRKGHLTLYKNTAENRRLFMAPYTGLHYTKILGIDAAFGFDEVSGMDKICEENSVKVWEEMIYIDIVRPYESMRMSAYKIENYTGQRFFFNSQGRLFHQYFVDEQIVSIEYGYIHFQKRDLLVKYSYKDKCFGRNGFVDCGDLDITSKLDPIEICKWRLNGLSSLLADFKKMLRIKYLRFIHG
jgi:hypothetical protein